jgi:hypothetical protein
LSTHIRNSLVVFGLAAALQSFPGFAQQKPDALVSIVRPAPAERDGQHDFDFEVGVWKTHLKRLVHPLTGSTTWVEYNGTSTVRQVWNGKANLLELDVDGPAGHIEGLSLRLYNPDSHQWSLNFANSIGRTVNTPTIGAFKDARGEFYDQETLNGRALLVRFVIAPSAPDLCRFEQAFSDDGGRTWEVNWVATDTRLKNEVDKAHRRFIDNYWPGDQIPLGYPQKRNRIPVALVGFRSQRSTTRTAALEHAFVALDRPELADLGRTRATAGCAGARGSARGQFAHAEPVAADPWRFPRATAVRVTVPERGDAGHGTRQCPSPWPWSRLH